MPIIFRSAPVSEPFTFDSVGNHWSRKAYGAPKAIRSTIICRRKRAAGELKSREENIF